MRPRVVSSLSHSAVSATLTPRPSRSPFWINYASLKLQLEACPQAAQVQGDLPSSSWFTFLHQELDKVSEFYIGAEEIVKRRGERVRKAFALFKDPLQVRARACYYCTAITRLLLLLLLLPLRLVY